MINAAQNMPTNHQSILSVLHRQIQYISIYCADTYTQNRKKKEEEEIRSKVRYPCDKSELNWWGGQWSEPNGGNEQSPTSSCFFSLSITGDMRDKYNKSSSSTIWSEKYAIVPINRLAIRFCPPATQPGVLLLRSASIASSPFLPPDLFSIVYKRFHLSSFIFFVLIRLYSTSSVVKDGFCFRKYN